MAIELSNEQELRIREGGKNQGLTLDIQGYLLDCKVRNLASGTIELYERHLDVYRGGAIVGHRWRDAPDGTLPKAVREGALEVLAVPKGEQMELWED